jgi:hypothetical protein
MKTEERLGYIRWSYREGTEGEPKADNPLEACHFCSACMENIMDYIMGKSKEKQEEKQVKEKKATTKDSEKKKKTEDKEEAEVIEGISGKHVKIDAGTMWALRKAGWSVPKIADDLGIETQAARNWFRKHKDEEPEVVYRPSEK